MALLLLICLDVNCCLILFKYVTKNNVPTLPRTKHIQVIFAQIKIILNIRLNMACNNTLILNNNTIITYMN